MFYCTTIHITGISQAPCIVNGYKNYFWYLGIYKFHLNDFFRNFNCVNIPKAAYLWHWFGISCKLFPVCMKCQMLFSGKNQTNLAKLLTAVFAQRVLWVYGGCYPSLSSPLLSLFSLSLGDDRKWPTRVDVSLNPNTIKPPPPLPPPQKNPDSHLSEKWMGKNQLKIPSCLAVPSLSFWSGLFHLWIWSKPLFRIEISVKNQNRIANSVAPDKMAHYECSHLDLHCWVTVCIGICTGLCLFVLRFLRPSQPNGVMSSAVSLPNHTFTGQA